ncbi:MAG TPA: hypothetical protein DCX52_19220 [Massilia sp.]|nr:hypothetical protein [Massilia sp.]
MTTGANTCGRQAEAAIARASSCSRVKMRPRPVRTLVTGTNSAISRHWRTRSKSMSPASSGSIGFMLIGELGGASTPPTSCISW